MRPAACCLLLALCLFACAEKIPPAAIGPGVAIPEAGPNPTLGVLPIVDHRPAIQHAGQKPSLIVLVIWNSRMGDYVTGEQAFQGDLIAQVTAQVAGAMNGGRFGGARVLDASPGDAPVEDAAAAGGACHAGGLRFVATGDLHDLYGTRHEKSYLWVLPTPWAGAAGWDRKRTDPLGVARLVLRVRDCTTGAIVFERDLRSENRFAHATLSEAAGLALTDVLQKLRNETLSSSPTPYVPEPAEYQREPPPSLTP